MLYTLFRHLNKDFEIIKILPQKPTARCPFSGVVMVDGEKKLVVIAKTDIQKFYLKRSIEKQREFFDDFSPYFNFNFPDKYGNLDNFSYAIYPYIENTHWCCDQRPIKIMEEIYKKHAKTYKMTTALLAKIKKDFLSSWPEQFHAKIKKLPLYNKYFDNIARKPRVKIYFEHCDYAVNNILDDGKELWLVDFEFSKNFQVIGHDLHDYQRTWQPEKYRHNCLLNKIKRKLMDDINDLVDEGYSVNKIQKKIERKSIIGKIKNMFNKHKKFSYPQKWDIKPTDKICILAPHPDDETIGCGGLLTLYASQCDVICLTDGRYGVPDIKQEKTAQIRKKEFELVMRKIGVNNFIMLDIEDSKLAENVKKFKRLNLCDYDYIVIPSPNDSHPDHLAVSKMLRKSMTGTAQIVYYEIWNTLPNQTHYINISNIANTKRFLITLYKSQVKYVDYADRILALNHYRGICHAVEYEEAYQFIK